MLLPTRARYHGPGRRPGGGAAGAAAHVRTVCAGTAGAAARLRLAGGDVLLGGFRRLAFERRHGLRRGG
ncbi:hypothetical protein D3C72_2234100 [compost metagenome]